mmetsp:Transcript_3091/g.5508  ORF Transcript_3091/g.5508 Transcript_3091/m.5508 type:complete len:171 (-) Transcript_3091:136-648(-)
MTNMWPGRSLLVVSTHLNSSDAAVRSRQIDEIRAALTNMEMKLARSPSFRWATCGVLLLGDMNISGGSAEYQQMLSALQAYDLSGSHSPYPYTYERGANPMVPPECTSKRIDYMLAIFALPSGTHTMPLQVNSFSVDKSVVLSDHWAVQASLVPASSWNVKLEQTASSHS